MIVSWHSRGLFHINGVIGIALCDSALEARSSVAGCVPAEALEALEHQLLACGALAERAEAVGEGCRRQDLRGHAFARATCA